MEREVRYTRSDEVHIAYEIVGKGSRNLVFVPGFLAHLEYQWEEPSQATFFRRLASFRRLIRFDKRGTGLSDRDVAVPTLEDRADDLRAVMDAELIRSTTLMGLSEGGPLSLAFAAMYPERVEALVLWNSYATMRRCDDHPWGITPETADQIATLFHQRWGQGHQVNLFAADAACDAAFCSWWSRFERLAMSPGAAVKGLEWVTRIDVRSLLPMIRVPTLVISSRDDALIPSENSRYLAEHIDGAKLVERPGRDHFAWRDPEVLDLVEEFLTGARTARESERVLGTVLVTDIVGSTELAVKLGDHKWRELLEEHNRVVRGELDQFRGRLVDTAGDGTLCFFDGPGRAIRCACSLRDAVRHLGIEIRAGLHAGEVALREDGIAGIAVHTGARVAALAKPGEVLVSGTVKDLTAGSEIAFGDRGAHTLKGVPGEWQLFAVRSSAVD